MVFDSAAATTRLHTLWIKTKIQNLGSGPPATSVDVANEQVEFGTRFTYLSSDLDSSAIAHQKFCATSASRQQYLGDLETIPLKPANKA